MSDQNKSDSSSSESEIAACSSKFDPLKALYSKTSKIPVQSAPQYETVQQYEAAQKAVNVIIPVGHGEEVKKREQDKKNKKEKDQKLLEEKNKQRFAKFQIAPPVKIERKINNVLTRIEKMEGPLSVLKDCVDHRLRIKVITRKDNGIRGVLHATLVAFDKQWNLALSDVLEIWKRKGPRKRKVPPGLGTSVPQGTAAKLSPVPLVTETPLGHGIWECTRHLPQLMMRGEHVVLINVVER